MRTGMPPLCVAALLSVVVAPSADGARQRVDLGPAAPGQTVRIPFKAPRRDHNTTATRVTIGEREAAIAHSEPGRVTVYVPKLSPGELSVRVYAGRRRVAADQIEIVAPFRRSFVFARRGEEIELLRVTSTSSEPTRNVRSMDARLSFDLVDDSGHLLYATSVLDPSEVPAETFTPAREGDTVSVGRVGVEHRSVFPVQLPAVPGATELRVYRAPAGLDIFSPEGRRQRILLRRFPLETGEGAP